MAGIVDFRYRVIRVGEWSKTTKLLAFGPTALAAVIPIAVKQEAQFLRRKILQNLKTQGASTGRIFEPHSEGTTLSRRFRGRPVGKRLIDTADLRNSITVHSLGDSAFVGVLRTARGKDGRPLANIARVHEFGQTITIPITRAMLRFLHKMFRENAGSRGQSGSSSAMREGEVLVVRIPPRPFIGPVVEDLYGNATKARARFFGRVGRLLRGQYGTIPPVPS